MQLEFVFGKHLKAYLFRALKGDTLVILFSLALLSLTPPRPVLESLSDGTHYLLAGTISHFLRSLLVWQGLVYNLFTIYTSVHTYIYIAMYMYVCVYRCTYIIKWGIIEIIIMVIPVLFVLTGSVIFLFIYLFKVYLSKE